MKSFTALGAPTAVMAIRVNEGKAKTMTVAMKGKERKKTTSSMELNEHSFVSVGEFNYVGLSLNETNEVLKDIRIRRRIIAGNRCLFGLSDIFRSKILNRKKMLRCECIRPCCDRWLYRGEA